MEVEVRGEGGGEGWRRDVCGSVTNRCIDYERTVEPGPIAVPLSATNEQESTD